MLRAGRKPGPSFPEKSLKSRTRKGTRAARIPPLKRDPVRQDPRRNTPTTTTRAWRTISARPPAWPARLQRRSPTRVGCWITSPRRLPRTVMRLGPPPGPSGPPRGPPQTGRRFAWRIGEPGGVPLAGAGREFFPSFQRGPRRAACGEGAGPFKSRERSPRQAVQPVIATGAKFARPAGKSVRAPTEDDGLSAPWRGVVIGQPAVWSGPGPVGRQGSPRGRAGAREDRGGSLPARPDTGYWHDHIAGKAVVYFLRGRLRFGDGEQVARSRRHWRSGGRDPRPWPPSTRCWQRPGGRGDGTLTRHFPACLGSGSAASAYSSHPLCVRAIRGGLADRGERGAAQDDVEAAEVGCVFAGGSRRRCKGMKESHKFPERRQRVRL